MLKKLVRGRRERGSKRVSNKTREASIVEAGKGGGGGGGGGSN